MARVRLQVCNREGDCVPVKVQAHQLGQTVSIYSDEVMATIDAITEADDELQEDGSPWEDNFDLGKLRSKRGTSRE